MEPEQVIRRFGKVIDAYGERAKEEAREDAYRAAFRYAEIAEKLCQSPIEITFFVAWCLRIEAYLQWGGSAGGDARFDIRTEPDDDLSIHKADDWCQLDIIRAQVTVEQYRPDFAVRRALVETPGSAPVISPIVLIECDGHNFHDRTPEQAARDKSRDRLLQSRGFYVLRFTGTELTRKPDECADQVDMFLDEHLGRLAAERRQTQRTNGEAGR